MAEIKYLDLENLNDEERRVLDEIVENWAKCNQVCDVAVPKKKREYGLEKVDEYMRVLPGADYVLTQTLNYIFSNGLTTGSINEDLVLDKFLYRKNDRGTTNLHELRDTLGMAITHGASGLRWLNGNVYQYKWGCYRVLTLLKNGIETVVGYIVSKNGKKVPPIKFDFDKYTEYADFIRDLDEKQLILLDTNEFTVIRNDTSLPYGHSPLLRDEARLDLLTAVYERLNYDIRYDGPGRIIIRPKDGFVSGDMNDISTTAVISEALKQQKKDNDSMLKEAKRVAKQLQGSSSDSVIVLSNAFSDKIEHLERVTKATEFFTWIKNDSRYVVHVSRRTLAALSTPQTDFVRLLQEPFRCAPLEQAQFDQLSSLFQTLDNNQNDGGFGSDLRQTVDLIELLLAAAQILNLSPADEMVQNKDFARINPILDYIQDNLTEPLSLDRIAGHFFLNKHYLCRIFKAATGFSVMDYIIRSRVLRARQLLQEGVSVQQAGEMSGFSDNSHFIRTFGHLTGVTPGRYAKEHMSSDQIPMRSSRSDHILMRNNCFE